MSSEVTRSNVRHPYCGHKKLAATTICVNHWRGDHLKLSPKLAHVGGKFKTCSLIVWPISTFDSHQFHALSSWDQVHLCEKWVTAAREEGSGRSRVCGDSAAPAA